MTYRIDAEAGVIYGRGGKALRGSRNEAGYLQIISGGEWPMAHRLIWESVFGPIPDDLEINHKNGVKDDNRIANLELVTRGENIAHAYRLGLRMPTGRYKITEEQVQEIRRRRVAGEDARALAREFGIGKSHVYNLTAAV